MRLPPCTDKIISLELSEVEDLNYRHLYRSIVYRLGKGENFSQDQVLQLRQACVHPQLVAHSEEYFGSERISMDEIFLRLVQKTKKDYETAVRDLAIGKKKEWDFIESFFDLIFSLQQIWITLC